MTTGVTTDPDEKQEAGDYYRSEGWESVATGQPIKGIVLQAPTVRQAGGRRTEAKRAPPILFRTSLCGFAFFVPDLWQVKTCGEQSAGCENENGKERIPKLGSARADAPIEIECPYVKVSWTGPEKAVPLGAGETGVLNPPGERQQARESKDNKQSG